MAEGSSLQLQRELDVKVLHKFELGDPCHLVHYKLGAVVEVSMWVTLIHDGVEFLESQ